MNRIITEQILTALIQYLGTKPMQEVEGLVNSLRMLPPDSPKPEPSDVKG